MSHISSGKAPNHGAFSLVNSVVNYGIKYVYNRLMARPKATAGKRQIRKLTKVGGGKSYSLALPVEIIRKFKWKERQKLTVTVDLKNKKLVIRDWGGYCLFGWRRSGDSYGRGWNKRVARRVKHGVWKLAYVYIFSAY